MKKHFHLIGINGIGLSGVARILLELGHRVTGSDPASSVLTDRLSEMGATVYHHHEAKNIEGADYIVVSSAVPYDNPEVISARQKNIPILHRAQMLGYVMKDRTGIAVSGTHGKTTTSSMIAHMLESLDLDPTIVVGGRLNGIMSNAKLGKSEYMVVEADESDASFLHMEPRWIIVTSVDVDVNLNVAPYSHLNFDYDKTLSKVKDAFFHFINRLPENGRAIMCMDDENVSLMLPEIKKNCITYGLSPEADLRAEDVSFKRFGSTSKVYFRNRYLGVLRLQVPGRHNVQNALAAIAQGLEIGLDFDRIATALYSFGGVKRRFEKIGDINDILIIDDYAHNPGKVRALLQGACTGDRKRVITVFQPHRYTRTKFLFNEFAESFSETDLLIVTEIYGAGECPIVGVRGEALAKAIRDSDCCPGQVLFIPHRDEVVNFLMEIATGGDLVITCGAGDIYMAAQDLKNRLSESWAKQLAAV